MTLVTEAGTVQFPLVRHAEEIGWISVSEADALQKRGGTSGLFFRRELVDALLHLNPAIADEETAERIVQRMESVAPTMEGNRELLEWLRGNRTFYSDAEERDLNVTLIDYTNADRNVFQVTHEWTYRAGERKGNRADIVFLINGVPVAVIENKNPKSKDALERAIMQFRRYELETPELLVAPQLFNVTHLLEYHYGVTWSYTRKGIFRWKEQDDESYRDAVHSFFDRSTFLTMLKEWVLFFVKDDELQKTVLRQHQTRAVMKVVARCASTDKRRGLVWHTQGSGKTFTLITAARLILEDKTRFPGATVLLVVDRNELEGQLSGWVERMIGEMRDSRIPIEYAASKAALQDLLDRDFRGLILSMIHKFDGIRKDSSTRQNFYVLIDEAHRSVSGPSMGNYLVGAMPNATLIGFTGTPIDQTAQGKGTFKTFGKDDPEGYLDKYSIKESIEDQTTVPLRHSPAPVGMSLPTELLDREFFQVAESEGVSDIEELNRILERAVHIRAFLKADDRIDKVAAFIAKHFRENVEPLGYKAFVVAVDREACALYKKALDKHLPAEYTVPVYTRNAADVIERPAVAELQLDEAREKSVRKVFPKPATDPKIFIVTDKLLTGYDAPILYCMYLDKPMRDHVLLQAVARVNRPYEDEKGLKKPCGLIIDFVGVLKELKKALAFDSKEVTGVIEALDELLARFIALMEGQGSEYAALMKQPGTRDAALESLIFDVFVDREKQQEFVEFFREVESLYEILSPTPELRDYVGPYERLVELYVLLRNAYGARSTFSRDVAHKTEMLVRESAVVARPIAMGKGVEFDAAALETLRDRGASDNGKVVNLVRAIEREAEKSGDRQLYLRLLSERARAVLDALEERQITTERALREIEQLVGERQAAEQVRRETGLDDAEFEVFWAVRGEAPADAVTIARQAVPLVRRFPNASSNSDEYRRLKAELYHLILRFAEGQRMLRITERILAATLGS